MAKKKKVKIEFRYYKMPTGVSFLALLGEEWVRSYGEGIDYLHFHNCMEIGYCHEGEGILTIGEKEYPYAGGMFSVIPQNCPHTTTSLPGTVSRWEYLFVDVEEILQIMYPFPTDAKRKKQMLRRINARGVLWEAQEATEMAGKILKILDVMREAEEFHIEEAKALLNAFLVMLARKNPNDAKHEPEDEKISLFVSNALSYISDHYMEQIRIENLAAQCHISETHFRRLFTSYMNIGPLEYINLVRIQNACELLRKTDGMVSEIAFKCGFTVLSTFNRNFKQIMGCSPYEWRKNPENFEQQILKAQVRSEEGW